MTDTLCPCLRKSCTETWHRLSNDQIKEQVTLTVPRFALEHAAYLAYLIDGAWSPAYKALAPFLLNPKPDPSKPID